MFIRTISAVAISAIAFTVLAGQERKPSAQPPEMSPEQQKAMEKDMQNAMPGPIHEHMTKCVGEYTTKLEMKGPGMEPEITEGTAKLSMSLDGRFLMEESQGEMMGMPYKTMKITGYNNGSKEYESVWVYTMSTAMLTLTGKSDSDGRTITWTGTHKEADGPHTLRVTTKHVDENTIVETISHADGAEEGPVMVMTYTRKN